MTQIDLISQSNHCSLLDVDSHADYEDLYDTRNHDHTEFCRFSEEHNEEKYLLYRIHIELIDCCKHSYVPLIKCGIFYFVFALSHNYLSAMHPP